MNYADNPRKIYGKVDIIYADEELTRNAKTTVNGNSTISHPYDVYKKPYEPTVKACTMDGHSTMDGTYQMMNDTVVCGWWSGKLSNSSGGFATNPYLELSFAVRPIVYWKVLGDSKLGQYPVDFTIQYKRNGTVVRTENVVGNTLMEYETNPKLDEITSVRLTISKWSTPNACAKILKFFERIYETYEGKDLLSFEVGEEMSSAEGTFNINSDSMTVTIYNEDRKFDKGYLRTLMLLDRKLTPYIGIERNGEIEYIQLGTYYSDEWNIPQDSQWVKCMATDRLMRLQGKTYVGFPLVENVSLYEIAEDIFIKTGMTAEDYVISPKLKDFVIGMALLPKTTVWDALQEIAYAALCYIYVDRQNRIVIATQEETPTTSNIPINPSNSFSYASNMTMTDFSNSISVEYFDVAVLDDVIDVAEAEVRLDPNETKRLTIDYTSEVAYPIISSNNSLVAISAFDSGVNSCTCTVTNKSGVAQTAILTVSGDAIEINSRTVTVRNEESILGYGLVEYKFTGSELVQSCEQAEYIASVLERRMRAGEGTITTVWRGNPELGMGQAFNCTDRFNDTERLACEYNKFNYDGGLKQETRGRKL